MKRLGDRNTSAREGRSRGRRDAGSWGARLWPARMNGRIRKEDLRTFRWVGWKAQNSITISLSHNILKEIDHSWAKTICLIIRIVKSWTCKDVFNLLWHNVLENCWKKWGYIVVFVEWISGHGLLCLNFLSLAHAHTLTHTHVRTAAAVPPSSRNRDDSTLDKPRVFTQRRFFCGFPTFFFF